MAKNHKPDLFVDTSGWGCYYDESHPRHEDTKLYYRVALVEGRRLVTTNYVIAELVALLTSPLRTPRPALIAFIEGLKAAPHIEIVHIDPSLDADAWGLLKNRQDKNWSLVDCASFVVMQRRGMTEALTTDQDFEQAGFVRLLRA